MAKLSNTSTGNKRRKTNPSNASGSRQGSKQSINKRGSQERVPVKNTEEVKKQRQKFINRRKESREELEERNKKTFQIMYGGNQKDPSTERLRYSSAGAGATTPPAEAADVYQTTNKPI